MLSVNGAARVSSIVRRKPMARDIDQIIERLKTEIPSVQVTQLQVTHPGADDDGLWFIRLPGKAEEVQLESPHGSCPFSIESDFSTEGLRGHSIDEVVSTVRRLFAEPSASPNGGPTMRLSNSEVTEGPPSVS